MPKSLNELMDEYDAERLADIARDEARRATPEAQARLAAKKAEEFARGVRLGWWNENGDPIPQVDDAEDEGEDE